MVDAGTVASGEVIVGTRVSGTEVLGAEVRGTAVLGAEVRGKVVRGKAVSGEILALIAFCTWRHLLESLTTLALLLAYCWAQ